LPPPARPAILGEIGESVVARKKRENEEALGEFLRQYGRPRRKRGEPNDRVYDRKLEAKVKRMRPEDLDELVNGPSDDDRPAD
jgi:hypothetical protein